MYRTFDEWSARGYKILKGSKATIRDGKPKFSLTQVEKYSKPRQQQNTIVHGDGWETTDAWGMDVHW